MDMCARQSLQLFVPSFLRVLLHFCPSQSMQDERNENHTSKQLPSIISLIPSLINASIRIRINIILYLTSHPRALNSFALSEKAMISVGQTKVKSRG